MAALPCQAQAGRIGLGRETIASLLQHHSRTAEWLWHTEQWALIIEAVSIHVHSDGHGLGPPMGWVELGWVFDFLVNAMGWVGFKQRNIKIAAWLFFVFPVITIWNPFVQYRMSPGSEIEKKSKRFVYVLYSVTGMYGGRGVIYS